MSGLAAIAEAMQVFDLRTYWEEPKNDRGWRKLQVTRLIEWSL